MAQSNYSLCTAIKVFVKKADLNKSKADELFIKAGIRLAELKAQLKPEDGPWYEYVKKNCGLSRERADEYIRMAKGHITPTESRARKAASTKKSRDKARASKTNPVPRGTGQQGGNGNGQYQDPAKVDTCDFNPTDSRPLEGEPYSVTRLRGYMWATAEAASLARSNLFIRENKAEWAKLDPQEEITDEVIEAAQRVADAWLEVVETLRRRRAGNDPTITTEQAKEEKTKEEKSSNYEALH